MTTWVGGEGEERPTLGSGVELLLERLDQGHREGLALLPDINKLLNFLLQSHLVRYGSKRSEGVAQAGVAETSTASIPRGEGVW